FLTRSLAEGPGSWDRSGPLVEREDEVGVRLVGERAVDLDLGRAGDEALLLAALAICRQMRSFAVGVERGVVLVLLVGEEGVGILRRPVRTVDEAAGLGLAHRGHLFPEERRQRVALPLRGSDLRDHRQHVSHRSSSLCPIRNGGGGWKRSPGYLCARPNS